MQLLSLQGLRGQPPTPPPSPFGWNAAPLLWLFRPWWLTATALPFCFLLALDQVYLQSDASYQDATPEHAEALKFYGPEWQPSPSSTCFSFA